MGLARPVHPDDVVFLQRAAGNRAVTRLLTRRDPSVVVQRDLVKTDLPHNGRRWDDEETYKGTAAMFRTTEIEATAWAEVEAAPPRIRYRRDVNLQTIDGIEFYLDIRGTVYLPPGTALPTTPDAALRTRGRLVRSQRSVHVEGSDVIEVREYSPYEIGGQSFGFLANAVMPDYAKLPLTKQEQEKAILAYLATLKRRPLQPTAGSDGGLGAVGIAADIGTDFIPIVGVLKDLYRAMTGEDPVTGEKLAWWERALAFLGAIPLIGKLAKGISKGLKFLGRGLSWLRGRGAKLAAWFAEKIRQWSESRRAKRLAKEAEKLRQLKAAEEEVKRLAQARRLAMTVAPTLDEIKKLVPTGHTWQSWGLRIFGQGPDEALAKIGKVTREELLALGVNRDVAQALRNWYKSLPAGAGASTRINQIQLLDHIIGLF
jgi:Pre-toxin TG